MKRLITIALGAALFLFGCTTGKNNVAIGDVMDVPNTELSEYMVSDVMSQSVIPGTDEKATVLLLRKAKEDFDQSKVCLVVQTKQESLTYVFPDEALEATMAAGDVDGDNTDEIVVQLQVAASGGAGYYLSYVFKADETLHPLWIGGEEDVFPEIDTGFTGEPLENYEYKVTNVFTNKSTIINLKGKYLPEAFDDEGKLICTLDLTCDTFFEFAPRDVDNDGICEIVASQYAWLNGHADGIGNAKTVLKFNEDTQQFTVVDSEFEHETAAE